jgi:GTPase-associated protein 1
LQHHSAHRGILDVLIEQAIFTSAHTDRTQGYQLIGRSPGLSDGDARELALWGPSHDSLVETSLAPASTNFHKLASGAYCVSRTTLAGAEFSGRGGAQVYTQFLVVPSEVLARFANNPFAILRAATASGALGVYDSIPETLEPLRLGGRSAVVDLGLMAQLARNPGPAAMATLIQAVLASDRLALASETPADQLLAGLFSALPVECRTEFSFSTGLKFSPSRPVRVSTLPSDPSSWRGIARQGVTLLNLDAAEMSDIYCWEGWAGCVAQILGTSRLSLLAAELEPARPWLNLTNIQVLADQVRAKLRPASLDRVNSEAARVQPPADKVVAASVQAGIGERRADGAHSRLDGTLAVVAGYAPKCGIDDLVATLAAQPAEVLELLERIDDLVFAAIGGDDRALTELEVLWPAATAELDADLVEQSREQYLRCALSIWSECVQGEVQRPERAVAAIDVLCVLFDQ